MALSEVLYLRPHMSGETKCATLDTLDIKSGNWARDELVFNQKKLCEQLNASDVSCPQILFNRKVLNLMLENSFSKEQVLGILNKDISVEPRCILSNTWLLFQFSKTSYLWKHLVKVTVR